MHKYFMNYRAKMKTKVSHLCLLIIATIFTASGFIVAIPEKTNAEAAEDLTTGLIGWWDMNDGTGETVTDRSSGGNNGSFVNPSYISWSNSGGPACSANDNYYLTFAGPTDSDIFMATGGYVNIGDIESLKPESVTLSAWIKRPAQSTFHDPAGIVGSLNFGEGQYGYGLYDNGGNSIGSDSYSTDPVITDISGDINSWFHITTTYDKDTGTLKIYKNGVLANTEIDIYNPLQEALNFDYATEFRIGAGLGGPSYFGGSIDDVRVYDRALVPSEIEKLAQTNTGCPGGADDSDGVSEAIESSAPNSGDANNDGTPDDQQAKVTSLKSSVNQQYVVLESSACASNTNVIINSEPAPADQDDDNYQYPAGLLNFTLIGCAIGATETVTQYYYGDYDASNVVLRKYDASNHSYTTITNAVITSVTIGGQKAIKAVYTIVDGGALDADGLANGTIVDPAGIGVLSTSAPNTGLQPQNQMITYALLAIGTILVAASYYGYKKTQATTKK